MAEYIFEINGVMVNGKTGEVTMKPTTKGELIRCGNCVYGRPVEGDEEYHVDCAHGITAWEGMWEGTFVHGVNWYCADAKEKEDQ